MAKLHDQQEYATPFMSEPGSNLYQYKVKMERVKSELIKFGLSQNQAKVFIYLGKYGAKSAPAVSKALDIPRTETYFIINTLQTKGIVTAEFSTPILYSALSISDAILTLVKSEQEKIKIWEMQEQELTRLWNEIPAFAIETTDTRKEKMQMLKGTPQTNNKIKEMISGAKEDICIFCTEKDLSRLYYADLIEYLSNTVADVRIIVSPAQKMPEHVKQIDRRRVRIMPDIKCENQCYIVRDHEEVLFFLRNSDHPSHNIFAMWADSRPLVDSVRMLFDLCWEKAENIY